MPVYEVRHICPLTAGQQDELAAAITDIHSSKFTTPRMFVQVNFADLRATPGTVAYIGGKRKPGNHVVAHVRTGPTRTQADFDSLCEAVVAAWDRIVPLPRAKGQAPVDYGLRSCVVLGGLMAGWEAGYLVPPAGGDLAWLREHFEEFEEKAEAGDEEMRELVEDVKSRGLLGGETAMSSRRRLEEMLGWGDAA